MTDSGANVPDRAAPAAPPASEPADDPGQAALLPRSATRQAVAVAWGLIVIVSALPAIGWALVGQSTPRWLPWLQAGVAVGVALSGIWWRPARPLWRFAVTLAALSLLLQALPVLTQALRPLADLAPSGGFAERMMVEQSAKLIIAAAMIGVLLLLGFDRRRFFLTTGELDAPLRPARLLGFPRRDPWWKFGLVWGFGIAAALFTVQWLIARPSAAELIAVLPLLPAILLFASINAFNEEMTYRAPVIATLEQPLGSVQALWMSAAFFGIAHYFGVPGGPLGAVASVFMGWILGKAMIETRGLFWAWFIHTLSDVAIFTFLAMALG
ncbi:CPBP family intramembrane glutamic endopeptidase [Microbacterium sp. BK668]|uniref:CPBP family intramembrane glutamic endopeptidase n=1 Tax=Microbacterium sp. BK668 TaxID=2512118 RepID=UPI0010EA6EED|nr:CPBP family intramembrane glutamic endopeptidase [Microbacterium sp. BK668]TDN91608.1 CAAX prenyl protease-like protein [Microbacterium sp. BK668]